MNSFRLLFLILVFFSCKKNTSNSMVASTEEDSAAMAAIILKMEGQTHTIQQDELMPLRLNFKKDSLLYSLYTMDHPVHINFNLFNTQALQKGSVDYTIPEANSGPVKVDLSFFNSERETKRTNKRIVFRSGTIHIEEISEHTLKMSFQGEASGMMDRKNNFPVSGSINIIY